VLFGAGGATLLPLQSQMDLLGESGEGRRSTRCI
jgi:hypothetical protein